MDPIVSEAPCVMCEAVLPVEEVACPPCIDALVEEARNTIEAWS